MSTFTAAEMIAAGDTELTAEQLARWAEFDAARAAGIAPLRNECRRAMREAVAAAEAGDIVTARRAENYAAAVRAFGVEEFGVKFINTPKMAELDRVMLEAVSALEQTAVTPEDIAGAVLRIEFGGRFARLAAMLAPEVDSAAAAAEVATRGGDLTPEQRAAALELAAESTGLALDGPSVKSAAYTIRARAGEIIAEAGRAAAAVFDAPAEAVEELAADIVECRPVGSVRVPWKFNSRALLAVGEPGKVAPELAVYFA